MHMNWERLGVTGMGILVIAGLFFIAIHWDPTGLISNAESPVEKVVGTVLSVIVFILGGFVTFFVLGFTGMGIYILFCWVFEEPITEPEPEPELEPEPTQEPEQEPEILEEVPRAALMDLS